MNIILRKCIYHLAYSKKHCYNDNDKSVFFTIRSSQLLYAPSCRPARAGFLGSKNIAVLTSIAPQIRSSPPNLINVLEKIQESLTSSSPSGSDPEETQPLPEETPSLLDDTQKIPEKGSDTDSTDQDVPADSESDIHKRQ